MFIKSVFILLIVLTLQAFSNTEIPFIFERNQIIVEVLINGKGPYDFLFDTGTDPSTINKGTADSIGLQMDTIKREGEGYGENRIIAYLCYIPKLEISGITQDSLLNVALDLSMMNGKFSVPVTGVLGYSFLKDRIFTIDYSARKIIFYEKKLPPFNDVLVNSKMILTDDELTPALDSFWIGGYPLKLIFDTGSSLELNLSATADSLYHFRSTMANIKDDTLEGDGGKGISYTGILKNFRCGKIMKDEIEATINSKRNSGFNDPLGSIGNKFLKDYKVSFDYLNKKVIISK